MLPPDVFQPLTQMQLRMIDAEHIRLANIFNNILNECLCYQCSDGRSHCNFEDPAACLGRLPSHFHYFGEAMAEHFQSEERIIGGNVTSLVGQEYFEDHKKDHERILHLVDDTVVKSIYGCMHGSVFTSIEDFQNTVIGVFDKHQQAYDSLMR